jgi:hypothetical protein
MTFLTESRSYLSLSLCHVIILKGWLYLLGSSTFSSLLKDELSSTFVGKGTRESVGGCAGGDWGDRGGGVRGRVDRWGRWGRCRRLTVVIITLQLTHDYLTNVTGGKTRSTRCTVHRLLWLRHVLHLNLTLLPTLNLTLNLTLTLTLTARRVRHSTCPSLRSTPLHSSSLPRGDRGDEESLSVTDGCG